MMCALNSSIVQKILVVVAIGTYALSLIIAYLNQAETNLFLSSNGDVDDKYYQENSPAGIAFGIVWPIIYLWNAAAILYIFISMFLSEDKSPVNIKPTLIPISFLACFILGFGSTIGWLFAFDREILILSFFILILSAAGIYGAVAILHKRVYDNLKILNTKEHRVMLWLVRIVILNGLCLPATWLTIATCLNLSDIIIYDYSFDMPAATRVSGNDVARFTSIINASTGILALLFGIIIVWFVLDNFVFEKYTRYTFTVFPVFILGLSGLVAKLRYNTRLGSNRNLIFSSVILAFTVAFFLIRIVLFVYRMKLRRKTEQNSTVYLEEKA